MDKKLVFVHSCEENLNKAYHGLTDLDRSQAPGKVREATSVEL